MDEQRPSIELCLRIATTITVIGYAWLTATALEPKFPQPVQLVKQVIWKIDGERVAAEATRAARFLESARLARAVKRSEVVLKAVGGLLQPVTLIFDADRSDVYKVSHEKIEMSVVIAQSPGELERAFVKTWLYQVADPALVSSLFRINVVSDVLTSLVLGKEPGHLRPWVESIASHASLCRSKWKIHELGGRCSDSDLVTAFAFRKLVAAMIVSVKARLSLREQIHFVEQWSGALRASTTSTLPSANPLPVSLEDWRIWVASEFRALMILDSPLLALERESLLLEVGLTDTQPISVTYAFRSEGAVQYGPDQGPPFLVLNENGSGRLYPGAAHLSSEDVSRIVARNLVWESCAFPRLGELLKNSSRSEKAIFVQSCASSGQGWASLLRGGVTQFAKDTAKRTVMGAVVNEPSVPFLVLRMDQINRAIRYGEMTMDSTLDRFMSPLGQPSLLGLSTAEWREEFDAYRVLGAIEAIEWFRGVN